eukprot:gene9372-12628_t
MTKAIFIIVLTIFFKLNYIVGGDPTYFNTPLYEIQQAQNKLYLTVTEFGEVAVTYAGKGIDFKPNDYISHADGVRILSGGINEFLKSGEKEAIIPIVDDEDVMHDGSKLMGFVMIQTVHPRKLSSRRGDIVYDMDEGGPPPTLKLGNIVMGAGGAKSTNDPNYKPPPHGGGACITGKDCNFFNGSCGISGCNCTIPYTGTYCQLYRPDFAGISIKMGKEKLKNPPPATINIKSGPPVNKASDKTLFTGDDVDVNEGEKDESMGLKRNHNSQVNDLERKNNNANVDNNMNNVNNMNNNDKIASDKKRTEQIPIKLSFTKNKPDKLNSADTEDNTNNHNINNNMKYESQSKPVIDELKRTEETRSSSNDLDRSNNNNNINEMEPVQNEEDDNNDAGKNGKRAGKGKGGGNNVMDQQQSREATIDELYGEGKAYPDPYLAGKVPNNLVTERFRKRTYGISFTYSVRFRNSPFGLAFDNRIPDASVVEKVIKGQQGELSDIRVGDKLLAIDQFNVSTAPAKATQRLMGSLPWPRILVFETKGNGVDPAVQEQRLLSRKFNISIIYPPTLVTQFEARIAEWTPLLLLNTTLTGHVAGDDFCPIFAIRAASDQFGCSLQQDEYMLPGLFHEMVENRGEVDDTLSMHSPMLSMMLQEADEQGVWLEPRSLAIAKRGLCTFVEKARNLKESGAHLGLVVNTDNEIIDMPSGKEKTNECSMPISISKESDAALAQILAGSNEVWAVISEHAHGIRPGCQRAIQLAEDIIDRWAHSVPFVSPQKVLDAPMPDLNNIRGLTEEGGRIAVSGENGWAFFDYHLAMFGPQEVPLGPFRLQMAFPPFGCDPNAYTVRIQNTVVAILRGGGCSFGIKVINAQKLGAKAVIIVNTDDMKTMRLMALPDEIPLINIPCIMVSRRLQYYLEEQLRKFYLISQHIVSIQPTGVFGDYEKKNTISLPVRLDG